MKHPIYKFLKENGLTQKDEVSFLQEYSNPDKSAELHKFLSENGLTTKSPEDFYNEYFTEEKKNFFLQSSKGSTAPQEQPTKPSATTGGLDYTRPSAEKSLYGKTIGGIVEKSAPLRSQTKEKPKQPPMDVTYTPEAMPSETTQGVVPVATRRQIQEAESAEKDIEKGQLPANKKFVNEGTAAKVEKQREKLGMNTLEEAAGQTLERLREENIKETFSDVSDEVDDYIKYSPNNSSLLTTMDYDLGSGKAKWKGFPGLGGKPEEIKQGESLMESQAKRGEVLKVTMDDYFGYLDKTNPSQAEYYRNKYNVIKSSKDRDNNDEKFLQEIEGRALKLRAAAIKKDLDVYKTALDQYSQIEKRVNFQGFDNDVKELKQSAKTLNNLYQSGKISEDDYKVRFNQIQQGFERARIKNGFTPEVEEKLDQAKSIYFGYGQQAMKLSSIFGFMDQNSKEYRQYNQLQKDIEEAKKQREDAWNSASWFEKMYMAPEEFARTFSGGVGNMVLDMLQAPKVLEEFVTGDTNYNFLDEWYDGIENFQLEKSKQFGETDSNSIVQYLTSLGGNAISSISVFALGGSLGGTSKMAKFGSTFTTAFLAAEAGAYEEAMSTYKMSPRQAASAATAVATATALVEGLIPDIKYFEPGPYRASILRAISEGKTVSQAAREALPESAKAYLKTGIKEGGEEIAGQLSEDVTKSAVNLIGQSQYYKDLWKAKSYRDSFLGGFIGGTVMNVFQRPVGASPISEDIMLTAAENADAIMSQNTNEKINSELKSRITDARKDFQSLQVHPNWSSLNRTKQAHVFGITQQIRTLESSEIKDPIINAQINKLKSEREEILSLGTNGIDSRSVGTATMPQRVMIGGKSTPEQTREIEVLNQKMSQFVSPRVSQLINEKKITRNEAEAIANKEWSETNDGKRREELLSQTQGQQANFFINEDGDYEIEYTNGRSVVIPKGDGAADKIREMGIKTDDGEIAGFVKENQNTLITPTLEKGATVDYNGKNAIVNGFKEKDGKVVYVNLTTEDGKTLQIREGQPGPGQDLLNNLNALEYDQENEVRISSQVGEGQKPIEAQPIQGAGTETAETSGVLQAQEEIEAKKAAVEKAQKQLDGVESRLNPNAKYPLFNVGDKHNDGNKYIVKNSEDNRTDTTKDGVEVITKILSPAEVDESGRMTKAADVEIGIFDSYEQAQEYVNSQHKKYKAIADEKLAKAKSELAASEASQTEAAPQTQEEVELKPSVEPKAELKRQIVDLNKMLDEQKAGVINYNEKNIKEITGTETSSIDLKEYEDLSKDIKKNGVVPVLIDKKTGIVIDGNHRLAILKKMGIENIPVLELDGNFFPETIQGDEARMDFLSEYSDNTPLVKLEQLTSTRKANEQPTQPTSESQVTGAENLTSTVTAPSVTVETGETAKPKTRAEKLRERKKPTAQAKSEEEKGAAQPRKTPTRETETEGMIDVMAAINSTKEALAQAGIDVVPMSNEEFMSNPDVIADGGGENTEGIFFAEDGKILLNLDMLKNKWVKTIVFHEGTHPIINIIRNTDPKRYKAIVEGMRREAQKNPKAFQSATSHAEQYRAEGEERVEDEFVTEVIAQIASGKLKLSNFTPSLRDQIISMINDILRALGLPQINLKSPEAAVRAAAEQITELLNKGGKLSEVVGSKNVGKYKMSIISSEAEQLIKPGSQIFGTNIVSQRSIVDSKIDGFDTTPSKVTGVKMKYPKQKETIEQVLEKSGGAAVFVNSDGTKVGQVLINGKMYTVQGGLDYTFIEKNYNDNVGFAASEDQKINTLNNISKQITEIRDKKDPSKKGKPVAVFVVSQNGEAMLGEWYAGEYIMEGIDKALTDNVYPGGVKSAKEDLINALNDLVITTKNEDGLKDNKARNKILDMIQNGVKIYNKQYTFDTHEGRMEIADFLSSKEVSFGFRTKLNASIIASNDKLTNSGKNRRMKKALANAGHHMEDFWNKFADERFLPGVKAEKSAPQKGKVFANKTFSGFYYDPSVPIKEQIKHTKKGVNHRQFNSKFKSQGDPFLLANAHDVNKLFPDMGYADEKGYEIYNKANKKNTTKQSNLEDRLAVSEWLNANGYNKNVINPYSSISLSIYTGYVTDEYKGSQNEVDSNDVRTQELIEEAKKHKTFSAFIKAQGKPIYHGSKYANVIETEGFKIMPREFRNMASAFGEGVYFADKKRDAYATRVENIVEAYIPKNVKLKKAYDSDAYKIDTKSLIEQGYDGVELYTGSGKNITIFDPSIAKTKTQLNDIWNRASEESKKGQKKGQRAIRGGRDIAETLDEFAPNVEETVDRIKSATKEDGATLNLDGTVYDNGGLVVPASSMNVAQKDMSAEGLFDFMKSNEENISSDIFKIGLYRFPDRAEVSYDLNIVIPREHRAVALEFGRLAGQESLFDLDTYENVKTGADGKNPRSFTAEELAEIAQELSEGKLPRVVGGQRSVKSGRDVPSLVDDAGLTKNMTEDEDGNYIFYHKTNKPLSKIDPKFFGKTLATSRDERPGVDISMYYTRKDAGESMVGGNYSYIVRVPKDKVYPINADPLNLYDKAKKEFQKDFPGQTFDPNKQIGYITKEAQKLGYDMTVAKWQRGPLTLRAQTTKALKPEVYYSPSREFPSAIVINEEIDTLKPNEKKMRRKGARSLEGGRELSQEDAYNAILDKIDELEATNMSPEEQFNEISQSEEYASLSPEDRMAVNDSYRESGVSTADKKIESVVTNDIKEQNAVLQSLKDDRDLAYIYRNFPQIIKQLQSKNIIETKGDCI